MKRTLGVLAGLTLAAGIAAAPAQAQMMDDARPITIGLAGGLSLPLGDFGENNETGYAVQGSIGFRPAAIPFGLRADVMYQSFGLDNFDGSLTTLSGTLNGLFSLGTAGSGLRPYLIGGVGIYNLGGEVEGVDIEGETKVGLNGGAGLRFALSGFNTFLEARYHSVFTDDQSTNFIPILFGVEF